MAIGDDALSARMELVPGTAPASDIDMWINKLADEVARRTMATLSVNRGGTGGTTAAAARNNLGIGQSGTHEDRYYVTNWSRANNAIELEWYGRIRARVDGVILPGFATESDISTINSAVADRYSKSESDGRYYGKGEADGRYVFKGGDTMSGNLFLPNASAASGSWTVAYINGDGRVSKGTSSLRYKDLLDDPDISTLGNIWPTLRQYAMKGGDGKPTLGYIAEEVAENPDTERFAVYQTAENEAGEWVATDVVDSIDFIQLLITQVAQLNERVATLEQLQGVKAA